MRILIARKITKGGGLFLVMKIFLSLSEMHVIWPEKLFYSQNLRALTLNWGPWHLMTLFSLDSLLSFRISI
ncbi:hypothetical protein BI343_00140 [Chromobacterium amazonense]|nr:hypothetical protein BI343_00140 [Chromobacterium amazonense]